MTPARQRQVVLRRGSGLLYETVQLSQSRTGSIPALVRKKTSGIFRGSLATNILVYHIRYELTAG